MNVPIHLTDVLTPLVDLFALIVGNVFAENPRLECGRVRVLKCGCENFTDVFYAVFMAALCNRGGPLYFCPVVSFLLSSFYLLLFFPRLISAAVDRMSAILLHMAWP